MSIVKLDKMTLYGTESQKEEVVGRLQELGCVHLINLNPAESDFVPHNMSTEARDALKYLRSTPEVRRQVRREEEFDREAVVAEVLEIRRREHDLGDEAEQLISAIEDLQPWGEFQLPDHGVIGNVQLWFYVVPNRDAKEIEETKLPFSVVNRDHQNTYVVVLCDVEPHAMPGELVELDPRPLSVLRGRLEEVEELLDDLRHQRIGGTRWCDLLTNALDAADDAAARESALQQSLNGRRVFAIQGWAPHDAGGQIRKFADDHHLAVTLEPPLADEKPPTLLDNPESLAGSEGLVTFYKTPAYRAWDPSIIAYISFAIFFAMIIADAGYGLVFGLLTAYLWKKMGQSQGGRRGRNILLTIVVSTIIYGVMCGSYFGVSPAAESTLGQFKILDAQSQELMMPLTIVIGVIHLSLANVVIAWSQRGSATALAPLGWVVVMAGATLAGIGAFADVSEQAGDQLLWAGQVLLISGLVAVFLFSSSRPLLSLSLGNHVLRIVEGLQGLTGLSGLFGDVLSYLRLFALGLSSAKLAETFNNLGASAWDNAGFGVIAAIGIVLLGHTLNILLSIMSGVVHGLRLNCIEFFKWSLPDEGYLFRPFAKKETQR